jgi:hypothetical protein
VLQNFVNNLTGTYEDAILPPLAITSKVLMFSEDSSHQSGGDSAAYLMINSGGKQPLTGAANEPADQQLFSPNSSSSNRSNNNNNCSKRISHSIVRPSSRNQSADEMPRKKVQPGLRPAIIGKDELAK